MEEWNNQVEWMERTNWNFWKNLGFQKIRVSIFWGFLQLKVGKGVEVDGEFDSKVNFERKGWDRNKSGFLQIQI